jgi:hypothetical protein
MPNEERIAAWRRVVQMSEELADDLRELLATGRLADAVQPF